MSRLDLGLSERVAVVAGDDAGERGASARALAGEGATVVETDLAGGAAAVLDAVSAHGRLDVVVAVLERHPEVSSDDVTDVGMLFDSWDPVLEVVELYQAAAPVLSEAGWGRFVAVVSANTKTVGEAGGDLDAMAGLGVLGFHKDVAKALGPRAVTANAVLRTTDVSDDEVAGVVAFLASDRSGYLTGITIAVDAGAGRSVY